MQEVDILNDYVERVLVPLVMQEPTMVTSGRNLKSVIELCIDVCIKLQQELVNMPLVNCSKILIIYLT